VQARAAPRSSAQIFAQSAAMRHPSGEHLTMLFGNAPGQLQVNELHPLDAQLVPLAKKPNRSHPLPESAPAAPAVPDRPPPSTAPDPPAAPPVPVVPPNPLAPPAPDPGGESSDPQEAMFTMARPRPSNEAPRMILQHIWRPTADPDAQSIRKTRLAADVSNAEPAGPSSRIGFDTAMANIESCRPFRERTSKLIRFGPRGG
jgi:hypothetical protein